MEVFHFTVKSIKNFMPYGAIQAGWVKGLSNREINFLCHRHFKGAMSLISNWLV